MEIVSSVFCPYCNSYEGGDLKVPIPIRLNVEASDSPILDVGSLTTMQPLTTVVNCEVCKKRFFLKQITTFVLTEATD